MYIREKDNRKAKDDNDYLLVKKVFNDKKGNAGARVIKMSLEDKGIVMNLKKIRRIMREYELVCRIRRVNKARVALLSSPARNKLPMSVNVGSGTTIPPNFQQ